jgi:two-component system, OmpR family, response regulator
MRLLLVDDDREQIEKIKTNLGSSFIVESTSCIENAIILASCETYKLIMISIGVEGCRGLELRKQIKAEEIDSPILAITHDCSSLNAAHILNCGADGLIKKPYCWSELLARVSAAIRQRTPRKSNKVVVGAFTLHLDSHCILYSELILQLQRKNKMILECLLFNHPRVVTRMVLYSQVWEKDLINGNNIDVQICQLRKSLLKQIKFDPIKTERGFGYRLVIEK